MAKDRCEDTEARPDLRGDGPVAGDELDADEDLLVDVPSEGSDADLCVDLVLAINIACNKHHTQILQTFLPTEDQVMFPILTM